MATTNATQPLVTTTSPSPNLDTSQQNPQQAYQASLEEVKKHINGVNYGNRMELLEIVQKASLGTISLTSGGIKRYFAGHTLTKETRECLEKLNRCIEQYVTSKPHTSDQVNIIQSVKGELGQLVWDFFPKPEAEKVQKFFEEAFSEIKIGVPIDASSFEERIDHLLTIDPNLSYLQTQQKTDLILKLVQLKTRNVIATSIPNLPLLKQKYQEAKSYETGEGKAKNLGKAFQLYEQLASDGFDPARVDVAFCLCHGMGTNIDLRKAAQSAQKLRGINSPELRSRVLYVLGIAYEKGYFEGNQWVQDDKKATDFFLDASNLEGLFGEICRARIKSKKDKNGIKINDDKIKTLEIQAAKGDPTAQTYSGLCYESDWVGEPERNKGKAFYWYNEAAVQGYAEAQYNLGLCYGNVTGVTKDEKEAFSWYSKAAEQGYATAQHRLGVCYGSGCGVEKNQERASFWYKKASELMPVTPKG